MIRKYDETQSEQEKKTDGEKNFESADVRVRETCYAILHLCIITNFSRADKEKNDTTLFFFEKNHHILSKFSSALSIP